MPPTISVLMSVYNGELYLAEAIESILEQSFTNFEFIIVDDGSTDDSIEIIEQYAEADKRIRTVFLNENRGLANALNYGLAHAEGQYIARMDSDDISLPTRFEQQINYLEEHPHIGLLGSRMQVVDKRKTPLFEFDVPLEHSLIVWNIFFGRTFAHPSVMIRREIIESVKGYNASLTAAQDVDLWARLVGLTTFCNLQDKLVIYRTHDRATSVGKAEQQNKVLQDTARNLLMTLWGDVSDDTVERFFHVRSGQSQFSMRELEIITAEMTRLAKSLLDTGWIVDDEMPLIVSEMERRINLAEPRRRKFWDLWRKRKD